MNKKEKYCISSKKLAVYIHRGHLLRILFIDIQTEWVNHGRWTEVWSAPDS